MKKAFFAVLGLATLAGIYTGCVSNRTDSIQQSSIPVTAESGFLGKVYAPPFARPQSARGPAATSSAENEYLAYYQYNPKTKEQKVKAYNAENWRALTPGTRYQILTEMYYANTRERSGRGLYHQACFTGEAENVLAKFFSSVSMQNRVGTVENLAGSYSSDGQMLGLQYSAEGHPWHFRLGACRSAGKGEIFPLKLLDDAIAAIERGARAPNAVLAEPDKKPPTEAQINPADGFAITDPLDHVPAGLPRFKLRADYDKATDEEVPWVNAGLDLSTQEGAQAFAEMLQKYTYEGMVDQDPKNPDMNFIAEKNSKRYWCHMPWLNQGANGREAIHGLTQELPIASNAIWKNPPPGGDWGVGYFNAYGCKAIRNAFGTADRPTAEPNISHLNIQDGTVVFKILFTTSNFPAIKNAFQWKANAADPVNKARSIRPVRHIQMDIAVKDSRLKGLASDNGVIADGWLMLTYYYDESYTSPLAKTMKLPEGFKHMRPMGIQSGFTEADSIIFPGAITNQVTGKILNGPADNPKSSCLGCHAAAGTHTPMAPGVQSTAQWREIKLKEANTQLEFGQQFALAKRNFQTRAR